MRNDVIRSTQPKFLAAAVLAATTLLLSACGGGGAATTGEGGVLRILPAADATAYAGVPFIVQILGGRAPYNLSSSEPTLFPLPAQTDNTVLTVIPQNPGVIDTGLESGALPIRTTLLNARDVNGLFATATLRVAQNFLLGYGVSYANACPAPAGAGAGGTGVQACPGNETAITIAPTFSGNLRGNALLRFERIRGDFGFFQCGSPPPPNPTLGVSITQNSDHEGKALVCIRVSANAGTQLATYRVIDVATGVYVDQLFTINGTAQPGATLTALPPTIDLVGTNGRCGTGSADFLIFGGTPPYTATSTNGSVSVTGSSSTQPGRFTVTVVNQGLPCPTGVQVVVLDATGARGIVTVNSTAGAAAPPIQVAPGAFTLNCGQSGTAVIVGGNGSTYQAFSSGGGVSASVGGNQVVVTRTGGLVAAGTQQTTVNITDGASIATITVDSPATCT